MINKLFYKEIESKIIINLQNATKNIKVSVCWFTNPKLANLLLDLHNKNVTIEIILSDDKLNFTNKLINFQQFIDENIEISVSKFPKLMHNKFCIIDNKTLINGSYNWTIKAEMQNFENITISTDLGLVNEFVDYFNFLQKSTYKVTKINKIEFGNYLSDNEVETELNLLENYQSFEKVVVVEKTNTIYTEDDLKFIDKVTLLHLDAKNEECVQLCKEKLAKNPHIQELYGLIASASWRLDRNDDIIKFATIAIEQNSDDYDSYNLLGIGFSNQTGGEKKSILNYEICIKAFPNEVSYYRNRAISNMSLENVKNLPESFREKFKAEANLDLLKIIKIVDSKNISDITYGDLHSRSFAHSCLENYKSALTDIEKAIIIYNSLTDKFIKDKNELIEMKQLLKEIKNHLK